jgi:hypothetical protein
MTPGRLAASALVGGLFVVSGQLTTLNSMSQGELKPTRTVVANVITSRADPAVRIRVTSEFQYVGGQRFILKEVADAEQHLFADALANRTIKRLYWIQFEQYLQGRGGQYNYDSDAPLTKWNLALRVHVRKFAEPPAAGSDQHRVHQLLHAAGLRMPDAWVRVRLVYVPVDDKRQELMIIYLEPASSGELTAAERANLIARATSSLDITPAIAGARRRKSPLSF